MRLRFLMFIPLVIIASCLVAHADTVYSYTGNNFTNVALPYTTSDFISGSFTVATPLGANQQFITLINPIFSFSDGVQTIDNTNDESQFFSISTDGNGNVSAWSITIVTLIPINSTGQISTTNEGTLATEFADTPDGFGAVTTFGQWTTTTTSPSAVPEPSSIALFSTGILGAIGASRRRFKV